MACLLILLKDSIFLSWQFFPDWCIKLNVIHSKIPAGFLVEINKPTLKCIWKCKGLIRVKIILKKKQFRGLSRFHFKAYYKATIIKRVWYWGKGRHIDQWNSFENSEKNPYIYGPLIFDKDAKAIQWRERIVLSTNVAGTIRYP